tara:strand:+ start:2027 stop:2827 length:801 start_codon:yes stop_codon:yes gene_type:complete
MAETNTFTVDTTTPTETLTDNLTTDEQDSLAVGEKIVEQQEQLLAGKYKDAQELEKAYMELQSKLGEKDKEDTETASATDDTPDEPKLSDGASLITDAQKEYYDNDNKLSDETLAKFTEMSSSDLLQAYMELNSNNPAQAEVETADISDAQISEIKESAGGDKAYANVVNWAKDNLDNSQTAAFDEVVNTGSVQAIKLAVAGLKAEYDKANGVEGRMVTGKTAPPKGDVFRSQAELVEAMNDKRYDIDPAYRQDVIEKLDRSDLNF